MSEDYQTLIEKVEKSDLSESAMADVIQAIQKLVRLIESSEALEIQNAGLKADVSVLMEQVVALEDTVSKIGDLQKFEEEIMQRARDQKVFESTVHKDASEEKAKAYYEFTRMVFGSPVFERYIREDMNHSTYYRNNTGDNIPYETSKSTTETVTKKKE